jgi:thiamine pyrophosphate-dependent acetolactate synthase large subunit-like protein
LENDPHEIGNNVRTEVALVGDAKAVMGQLAEAVKEPLVARTGEWWKAINEKIRTNQAASE